MNVVLQRDMAIFCQAARELFVFMLLSRVLNTNFSTDLGTFSRRCMACPCSGAHDLQHFLGLFLHEIRIASALDVEPHDRLGIGHSYVKSPFLELEAITIRVVDAQRTISASSPTQTAA